MNARRVRTFAVTVAMVLGAGTMSSFAAPLLQTAAETESRERATDAATQRPTRPVEETSEPVEDTAVDERDERRQERAGADEAAAKANRAAAKQQRDAAKAERKAAQADRKAAQAERKAARKVAKSNNGKGNAHGKTVSDAARGVTEPVGNCRNHGHWVSTVAKGKSSCDGS